jgi:hypothetical protein
MKSTGNGERNLMPAGLLPGLAITVLVVAMFSANKRAAAPALLAIGKFLWPLLVVWIVWRFIKSRVTAGVQKFQQQIMQAAQHGGMSGGMPGSVTQNRGAASSGNGQIIDLCPSCGTLLAPGHRCAKP